MRLLVKVEGGPSPGVTISGERDDLIALSQQLKVGAEAQDHGRILLKDVRVEGEPHEWIEFEVVKSFPAARDDQKVKAAPIKLLVVFFFIFGAAICYLAFRGLRTF